MTEKPSWAISEEWAKEPAAHESKAEAGTVAGSFEAEVVARPAAPAVPKAGLECTGRGVRIK
jgi:hypothetical protein